MQVTMIDFTENPELKIATYAGICYDADTSPDRNEKRVQSIMKQRHLATLRFAYATFKIEGVSRVCSHQLVRHPHLSFLQRSSRYCKEGDMGFVVPESIRNSDSLLDYQTSLKIAVGTYEDLIASGVRKEDARFVLPQVTARAMPSCQRCNNQAAAAIGTEGGSRSGGGWGCRVKHIGSVREICG